MNVSSVVRDGLCTQCGTCAGVCPMNAITMTWNQDFGYLPTVSKALCNNCDLCLEICPGISVNYKDFDDNFTGAINENHVIGKFLKCYAGWVIDQELRWLASSGGMVTGLLDSAIKRGIIDGAIVTTTDPNNPLKIIPIIARNSAELRLSIGSKYSPVALNSIFKDVIKSAGTFAFVGLPCHIHGLRKAQKKIPDLREKITITISLLCSVSMAPKASKLVLAKNHINIKDVVYFKHRGKGWPGFLWGEKKNGELFAIPIEEYYNRWFRAYILPRCKLCNDGMGELSDISFGDAWLPNYLTKDNPGTSIIIVRNCRGEKFFDAAGKDIVNVHSIAPQELLNSQKDFPINKKGANIARISIRRFFGLPVPNYDSVSSLKFIDYYRAIIGDIKRILIRHLSDIIMHLKKQDRE